MGDNVIVFDFIRDDIAIEIFESMVAATLDDLVTQNDIRVELQPDARDALAMLCLADLSNGGRASETSSRYTSSIRWRGSCSNAALGPAVISAS